MTKIIVASKNPVKIKAVAEALASIIDDTIDIQGVAANSGVADQPMGDNETLTGAENRARQALAQYPGHDYYVGIEGGAEQTDKGLMAYAWMVITNGVTTGRARSASFFLPPMVARLVASGMELGDADDIVFKKNNSKQQNGAVGLLTNNTVTRQSLYAQAIQLAFIPFINSELFATND